MRQEIKDVEQQVANSNVVDEFIVIRKKLDSIFPSAMTQQERDQIAAQLVIAYNNKKVRT